ncbi:MAG: hypothetical protein HFJ17_04565 [Clostridia bacterium]|nr:hypothetical protein [Clostridia bacterium]
MFKVVAKARNKKELSQLLGTGDIVYRGMDKGDYIFSNSYKSDWGVIYVAPRL